jgi:hypothetical protein
LIDLHEKALLLLWHTLPSVTSRLEAFLQTYRALEREDLVLLLLMELLVLELLPLEP